MSSDKKPTIRPMENGPYLVEGMDNVAGGTGPLPASPKMALCRCGGSRNKPFCDGTHAKNGFSSARSPERTPDAQDDYHGTDITVHDNRGICAHAGRCTDGLPSVFRLRKEPFVDPSGARAEEIREVIRKCPSGALSFTLANRLHRDNEGAPTVFIAPNGPYVVSGGPDLLDTEWGQGASKEHFTLCRCGGSRNKPFCDGTHWTIDFDEHAKGQE